MNKMIVPFTFIILGLGFLSYLQHDMNKGRTPAYLGMCITSDGYSESNHIKTSTVNISKITFIDKENKIIKVRWLKSNDQDMSKAKFEFRIIYNSYGYHEIKCPIK